jgi:ribonuclease R
MNVFGKLIINDFGNGFINIDNKTIYIEKSNLNNAFNGEIVEVEYYEENNKYFGKVINYKLVDKTFVGQVHHIYMNEIFIYVTELTKSKLVSIKTNMKLNISDWAYIKIINIEDNKIYGEILEKILDISIDNLIQKKFKLNNIDINNIITDNKKQIKDLTDLDTFTIDPPDSIDCDDAFSINIKDGKIYIYVHISDVSYWLNPSIKDFDKIIKRGNTIYGVNKNWPMLSDKYANNICSILPDKETQVITNEFIYDNNKLLHQGYYFSKVKSKHKYSYDNIDQNKYKIIYESSLIIKKEINDFIINEDKNNHEMVKYWMIKINQIMPKYIFRCHKKPTKTKLLEKFIKYKKLNIDIKDRNQILNIKNIVDDKQLYNYIIQSMLPKAYYNEYDDGHYGLGIDNYTHWTSPIRRACDLLNHCILRGYDIDINQYIDYINHAELIQLNVEKFIKEQQIINHINVNDEYDSIIIDLTKYGISVYIYDLDIKTSIHISKLSKNKLVFNNEELINENYHYKIFNKLKIKVEKINQTHIEFCL